MAFVKLDTKILDSSIWFENSDTKVAWITMLAMANPDGLVEATLPGISHRAGISKEATKRALEIFEGPDVNSKNPADEGKRIRRVNGGYMILNYEAYRKKDHTSAERVRRFRERSKQDVTPLQRNESPSSAPAPAVKRKQKQQADQSAFDSFWGAYPRKVGKGAAEKAWRALKPDAELLQQMLAALEWQRTLDQWTKDGGQYIPNPSTWLNQKRWEDERPAAGGNGRSSLSIGAPRPEPSEPVDEVAAFLERFPEDLQPLRADIERYFETRTGRDTLIDKMLGLFAGQPEYESKVQHFLQSLAPKLRTPSTEETYRKNYLAGKFNIPEL